ncbi:hypothetical protein AMIS_2380 [Actinoplanes missouriensis 431]|uniref:Uncharacterized protein n=1 Tax=Actinoplanes missouriensis (strain ATCC 14538 / DSM 43046 / CBS 188.64 / JCM 3121 / NBRC 102363 / NCIMB 12654 / NRRL B-3342 / UNCC 431) TaxID=512565 RepID=I0GXH1_ACTM4|nr:hypothetical protein [Actinoplanes missouriensis]BAL85458.1 hypothetical protein AMIS_2380 [Actinoplanes missouriensis 431]
MADDELVELLRPPDAGPGVQFRQGVVMSWNQETAENLVAVDETVMANLSILNTSEAAILNIGDVVSILVSGNTWGILGRFTIPGSPEAVSALSSLRTQSASVTGLESFTSTSFKAGSGPVVSIVVGKSGRLMVFLAAEISAQGTTAAANTIIAGGDMGFALSGANTLGAASSRAYVVSGNILVSSSAVTFGTTGAAGRLVLLEGLTPGLTTITAMYRRRGGAVQANFENRNITAMAL